MPGIDSNQMATKNVRQIKLRVSSDLRATIARTATERGCTHSKLMRDAIAADCGVGTATKPSTETEDALTGS